MASLSIRSLALQDEADEFEGDEEEVDEEEYMEEIVAEAYVQLGTSFHAADNLQQVNTQQSSLGEPKPANDA